MTIIPGDITVSNGTTVLQSAPDSDVTFEPGGIGALDIVLPDITDSVWMFNGWTNNVTLGPVNDFAYIDAFSTTGTIADSGSSGENVLALHSFLTLDLAATSDDNYVQIGGGTISAELPKCGGEYDFLLLAGYGPSQTTICRFAAGRDHITLAPGLSWTGDTVTHAGTTLKVSDGSTVFLSGVHISNPGAVARPTKTNWTSNARRNIVPRPDVVDRDDVPP